MEKYYVTIKEIHEFADKVAKERPGRVEVETYDFIHSHGCTEYLNAFDSVYFAVDYEYRVEVGMSENGHIVAHTYDYDEMIKYFDECEKVRSKYELGQMSFDEFLEKEPDRPDEKFHFEVPLTRGYSDTSERTDTNFTVTDVGFAIEEYIREKEGKQKIYPWMVRQFANAGDFGVCEEEFSELLEMCCG